jgi:hypothetical protein
LFLPCWNVGKDHVRFFVCELIPTSATKMGFMTIGQCKKDETRQNMTMVAAIML